jgi:DNA modification methylase
MDNLNRCLLGDCRDVMRQLIADGVKVQTIVTSPPYYGLRDYGVDGQLGLEETPQKYIDNMVEVFRVAKDLLADDGTLWLNIGDSYCGSGKGSGGTGIASGKQNTNKGANFLNGQKSTFVKVDGVKSKDLIGVPWMLAFALRADGWYLRQDIIWNKPNPMPESVTDRCTKAHEYVFLLSKSSKYYFDNDAIKEPAIYGMNGEDKRPAGVVRDREYGYDSKAAAMRDMKNLQEKGQPPHSMHIARADKRAGLGRIAYGGKRNGENGTGQESFVSIPDFRNKRSVWTINTKPCSEAHFAVMPEELVETCVLAGSKVGDIVFDPFMGSGTVGKVAQHLGRKWFGAELNPDYIKIQNKRTSQQSLIL